MSGRLQRFAAARGRVVERQIEDLLELDDVPTGRSETLQPA